MKKIGLFLCEEPFEGGKFQYSLSMVHAVAALPRDRYEILVGYNDQRWLQYLAEYDLKLIHLPFGVIDHFINKVWRNLKMSLRLFRAISPYIYRVAQKMARQKMDLWIFPVDDKFTFQVPVPALTTIHDLMHRYEPRFPEVSGRQFEKREYYYGNICRWAQGLLVDSEMGRRQVAESYRVSPDKIHVLPYIAPQYIFEEPDLHGFEQRYQLPPKYIFYPAQFWEHKNHQGLVQAAALLKDQIPDIHLVFVGAQKNGYQSILDLVKEKELGPNIHFLGYVPNEDMPELYRRARAMIMPTFFGPTNIPPLEAMAMGCPAAVSDNYAMKEQVGDAALLFDPYSVAEIAGCLCRLWKDDALCRLLAKKSRERVRLWEQPQFNQRLESILNSLMDY